ncbi:MAG: hypothetical protein Sapg2KO_37160 [Saprospiraceae bacterium]
MLFCLSSCVELETTRATQQQTWVEVYGRYLDSDQLYKLEFTFLRGDTFAIAKSFALDGNLNVLGQTLEGRKLSEQLIRYQKDFKGDFNGKITGRIADEAIAFKKLDLSFKPVPNFQILGDSLNINLGGSIVFSDSLYLATGEELLIMVNDEEKQTVSLPIKGPFQVKKLTIPVGYLEQLNKTEQGSLYVIAKKQVTLEEKNQTLTYLLEHYSVERKVQLLD